MIWSSVICIGLLSVHACGLSAAVQWDNSGIELNAGLSDEVVAGEFGFTVIGDSAATITSIVGDCGGCTVVPMQKAVYAPGEKGTVSFRYSTVGREGIQRRQLKVVFAGDDEPASILSFTVSVPYVFQAKPRVLEWHVGEAVSSKEFVLASSTDGVEIRDMLYDQTKFSLKSESVDGRIKIFVSPISLQKPLKEKVIVQSNVRVGESFRATSLYLLVSESAEGK